ncbi:MAG TPA: hypothetical protein VHN80_15170 [Kineosporiaceae bacterium]|nr:hypothetical protein [Kineosporiaceae bacterium]
MPQRFDPAEPESLEPSRAASPVSPERLAGLIADLALTRPGLRLGIEGPVADDARSLADAVTAELAERAVPVARVHAGDFLRARSLRLEHGPDDPDAFYDGWYDLAALRREVLDPMASTDRSAGGRSWLPRLRDPGTDRPYREPRRTAAPATVLVVDGMFLARWDVADAVDVLVHLDVSPAARARRVPPDRQARVLPAWERYLEWCDPASAAAAVVRYDRPSHPAVRTRIA